MFMAGHQALLMGSRFTNPNNRFIIGKVSYVGLTADPLGYVDEATGALWTNSTVALSSAQAKFGSNSALVSPGALTLGVPSQTWLLSGDYSLECWCWFNSAATPTVLSIQTSAGGGSGDLAVFLNSSGVNHRLASNPTRIISDGAGSVFERWLHVFSGRQGGTTYTALNGVMRADVDAGVMSGTVTAVTGPARPVNGGSPQYYFQDFVVTNGYCWWTSSFTPPTAPKVYP